jgi:flagellar hook protein FlgE
MMRSLYSGVAGLKTHQTKMDVIGNNIANVNTTAYKSSSIVFSELMSQTTQKASGPNATTGTGGTNARQIGLGVKSGAINVNISTQGSAQSTGNPFDIMITGDNFFVVNNGTSNYFTRDGSFYVDGAGNLAMTSTGYNVMGWLPDDDTGNIKQDTVSALRIMSAANLTYPPEATSKAYVSGIIDQNDTDVTSSNGKSINLNFYDNLGYSYTARFVFKQSADNDQYSVEMTKLLDSEGNEVDISNLTFGGKATQDNKSSIIFNDKSYTWDDTGTILKDKTTGEELVNLADLSDGGKLKDNSATLNANTTTTVGEALDLIAKAYGYEGSTDEFLNMFIYQANPDGSDTQVTKTLSDILAAGGPLPTSLDDDGNTSYNFETDGRVFTGATITYDSDNGKFKDINGGTSMTLNLSALGGNFSDISIDFSETTEYDNKGTSTIGATSGDIDGLGTGRRLGDMIGVSIQNNGMIYASYDNGMTKLLGQIATASFANASGLEKEGDNLYSSTLNSGDFDGIGVDVTANGGYMSTGQLEMSNVDLSTEFTEMITTQRGFQANSRIITVSDTLLEELTNLKR